MAQLGEGLNGIAGSATDAEAVAQIKKAETGNRCRRNRVDGAPLHGICLHDLGARAGRMPLAPPDRRRPGPYDAATD
jgi:hypothetical protein